MIHIKHNNKIYLIKKENIIYVLEKLENGAIKEKDIEYLMKKYELFDEYFLDNINKLK